jgi:hypothetical protein
LDKNKIDFNGIKQLEFLGISQKPTIQGLILTKRGRIRENYWCMGEASTLGWHVGASNIYFLPFLVLSESTHRGLPLLAACVDVDTCFRSGKPFFFSLFFLSFNLDFCA